jgi:polysaccharide biosynthesis/export protein
LKNKRTYRTFFFTVLLFSLFLGYWSNSAVAMEDISNQEKSYTIGKGDILSIVTWKEPDLSKEEVLVRIDGNISFPLLNDVPAAGSTTMQLKDIIEIKLKKYVANPVVTVTVVSTESQKFYVLGEVANTGEYSLNKELTVLQAFALAGGFTEWAQKDEIILFRKYRNSKKVIRLHYKEIIESGDFSKNITIKANDTIIVP